MKDLSTDRTQGEVHFSDWLSSSRLYAALGGHSMTTAVAHAVLIDGKELPSKLDGPLARAVRQAGILRRQDQNDEFVAICDEAASDLNRLEISASFAFEIEEEVKRELKNCEGFFKNEVEEAATRYRQALDALRIYQLEHGEDSTAPVRLARAKKTTAVLLAVDGLVVIIGLWTAQVSGGVLGAVALGAVLSACTISMAYVNGKVRASMSGGRP